MMKRPFRQHRQLCLLLLLALAPLLVVSAGGAPPETRPVAGIVENTPAVHALVGAKIVVSPERVIDRGTLVLRDGVIVAVGEDVATPADARVWDLTGRTIYAGLIDPYSQQDVKYAHAGQGAGYWNDMVTPQLAMADHYQTDKELNKKLRSAGIVARLAVPKQGIIKGTSAVVATSDAAGDQAILQDEVALHMELTLPGRSDRDHYPNSPMGAVALARQALYDARWYGEAWDAFRAGGNVPRPERNDALAALQRLVADRRPVIVDTSNELFALRADRYAREFALNLIVRGSGHEYRRLDAIRDAGRPILVPVNYPKPPNVATPETARNVSIEEMLHWDLASENAARLEQAGVRFAFTAHGLKDPTRLLAGVRKAVERGLAPAAALRGMTVTPAELLGVSDRLGRLQAGFAGSLLVTDGDLFAKGTKLLDIWVEGEHFPLERPAAVDLRGEWLLELSGKGNLPRRLTVSLAGEPEKLTGSAQPEKSKTEWKLERLGLRDMRLAATFKVDEFGQQGIAQLSVVASVNSDGAATWFGELIWPDGTRSSLTASRAEDEKADKQKSDTKKADKSAKSEAKSEGPEEPVQAASGAAFPVNYPLGAFGVDELPAVETVLFRGATVWTSDKQGVLTDADVLIADGKIVAVGQQLTAPQGARIVDASGQHITPGIVDCHSHMATDGGVNESSQAVTCEVRIGDFIDCDDIEIYRQLAGGVTTSNILHGSANPIGGQNQVIKLRWGQLSEAMKFAGAPEGVKFALGENVKQSNWGDKYTSRYPQTRMGVEQIIRDTFARAAEYRRAKEAWQRDHAGLPPRHDLELEAIDEVMRGKRWIHCHSYRQDEILALLRTLDEYKITIGTLQHILEGYKVADAMARHGAMGSAFADWWAYKFEVYDAIPYNGALMHEAGIVVSFNSDDREMARRLNQEAAKAVKYGGVAPIEALKFVTINPAIQLRIADRVGSLTPGKDADLVVWSGDPLSNYTRCEQTWVDGRRCFDRQEDAARRERATEMRHRLVQLILSSGEEMRAEDEENPHDRGGFWPRDDIFCAHGDHGHGHGHGHAGHAHGGEE